MQRILILLSFISFLLIIISCNKGIEPAEVIGPSGFEGKVTFTGKWPEGIKRTHLVVFKNEIKTIDDFFLPNLSFVADSIPYGSKEYSFNSLVNSFSAIFVFGPGYYSYIAVAQQKTQFMTFNRADWFVVGVYCENGYQNKLKTMVVLPGHITSGININVDFNNPPPQPPM